MIKCGTIAALVIAGGATGTASLLSYTVGTERVAAGGQEMRAKAVSQRGTRSTLAAREAIIDPLITQPRRGTRAEYQTISIAMSEAPANGIRRGTR